MKRIFVIISVLFTNLLFSNIINVPADQPTIQEGINVAVDSDTVLVQPDTYIENINYNGKNITVASLFLTTQDTIYICQTIIDGNSSGNVVIFENEEDETTILIGFTIINGYAGSYPYNIGGGILCGDSSPSLQNLIIIDNSAGYFGGGISCWEASPSLENVIISGNTAGNGGGGIYCQNNSSPGLENVTISGNSAVYGGGIYCVLGSSATLIDCILWDDTPQEVYFAGIYSPNSVTIAYSDIEGGEAGIVTNNNGTVNWLEGNIDEDPIFTGIGEHPLSLQEDSPCIDAGIPDTTGLNLLPWDIIGNLRIWDGDGNGSAIIDMGAYEYGAPPYVEIDDNVIVQTSEVLLHQNYPNPFNPTTIINYSLKENSKVSLNIYNIKGQKVKTLINEVLPAGEHSIVWDGRDSNDKRVGSGIYLYQLQTGSEEQVRKMLLLK